MSEKKYAEISGKIVSIMNNKTFKVNAVKMNKDFICVCNSYCLVDIGDAIHGICECVGDNKLIFVNNPCVMIGEDLKTIIRNMTQALRGTKFGANLANNILDSLICTFGSLKDVVAMIDEIACKSNYKSYDEINDLYVPFVVLFTKNKFNKLLTWWYKNRCLRRLYLLGMTDTEIEMGYNCQMDPNEIYNQCLINPYGLINLTYEKCDSINKIMGNKASMKSKMSGVIIHYCKALMDKNEWSSIPLDQIKQYNEHIQICKSNLETEFGIKFDYNSIYLKHSYEIESYLSKYLSNLIFDKNIRHIHQMLDFSNTNLNKNQIDAIETALSNNVCIITGGAGTGKTTVIKHIINILDLNGIKYRAVSFTGKAVSRLREVLNKKNPATMNRLMTKPNEYNMFEHLIIDEVSMVTSKLLYDFVKKFPHRYKITFVGDPNQLPPIGAGDLLQQMILSKIIPVSKLSQIHRTKEHEQNGISINSKMIIDYWNNSNPISTNFKFIETDNFRFVNSNNNINSIENIIKHLSQKGANSSDISILTPYNKDLAILNNLCQNIFNPYNINSKDSKNREFRLYDRVMMRENNNDINIMNGEEGIITDISEKHVFVTFKNDQCWKFYLHDSKKSHKLSALDIDLSFAISIHRSEGSEWKHVIIYIPDSKISSFLNRKLLYTAITRASDSVYCIGNPDIFNKIATTDSPLRYDNLNLRLNDESIINLN